MSASGRADSGGNTAVRFEIRASRPIQTGTVERPRIPVSATVVLVIFSILSHSFLGIFAEESETAGRYLVSTVTITLLTELTKWVISMAVLCFQYVKFRGEVSYAQLSPTSSSDSLPRDPEISSGEEDNSPPPPPESPPEVDGDGQALFVASDDSVTDEEDIKAEDMKEMIELNQTGDIKREDSGPASDAPVVYMSLSQMMTLPPPVYISWAESLMYFVPAALYALANNLFLLAVEYFGSALTAQVFGAVQALWVGMFTVILLRRKLTVVQWIALIVLCNSIITALVANCTDCDSLNDFPIKGVIASVVSTMLAALSGVFLEKTMKDCYRMSVFQQSVHLYGYGIIVNLLAMLVVDRDRLKDDFTFNHFNISNAMVISSAVWLGFTTAFIVKYLSSVIKVFAASASLFLTAILSVILFDDSLSLLFAIALINLVCAFYLYKVAGGKPKRD